MNILANDGLDSVAVNELERLGHTVHTKNVPQSELINWINENQIECLMVRSATKVKADVLEACPGLKYIGRAGVGVDNIDIESAKQNGKIVFNTPTASSRSVAELVVGMIYSWSRNIHYANMMLQVDNFKALKKELEDTSFEISGKTLGIIGFGSIGREVQKLASANGMKTLIHDPYLPAELDHISCSKDRLLSESDFVTVHISGSTEVLNMDDFNKMKNTAEVINASRGGCINEEDLLRAVNQDILGGACLDTFMNEPTPMSELVNHPWILVTPHIGGATVEAQGKIGMELVTKLTELSKTETKVFS